MELIEGGYKFKNLRLTIIILLTCLWHTFVSASVVSKNLHTAEGKLGLLTYFHRKIPEFYQEFVVRTNSVTFLDRAQQAVDVLGYDANQNFHGYEISIFDFDQEKFEIDETELSASRAKLIELVRGYTEPTQVLVMDALNQEILRSIPLDGIKAALMKLKILNSQEIFSEPVNVQIQKIRQILSPMKVVPGVFPHQLGIHKTYFSGPELSDVYADALMASDQVKRLIWLALLSEAYKTPGISLKKAVERIEGISQIELLTAFRQEHFLKSTNEIIRILLSKGEIPQNLRPKIYSTFKTAYNLVRSKILPNWDKGEHVVMSIRYDHPYSLWLRGGVGDCATDNSPFYTLLRNENTAWILRPDRSIKGYIQFTKVRVNDIDTLYVHTVSGAATDLTANDVKRALLGLFDSLEQLEAKQIVIIHPDKVKYVVNNPELAEVFRELSNAGKVVPIEYSDGEDRHKLAPFTDGSLDLPETNEYGVLLTRESVGYKILRSEFKKFEVDSKELFPEVTRQEAVLVALDLRNRNGESAVANEILRAHKISLKSFEKLWRLLSNEGMASLSQFHQNLRRVIRELKLPVNWSDVSTIPILFRGHFNAPDALEGDNMKLAVGYIDYYLRSFTDLSYFYDALGPKFGRLVKSPEFIGSVRYVFRRNIRELDRILDPYALTSKSAYRTLINLFKAGLPPEYFINEIAMLNSPIESSATRFTQSKERIIIRRTTLLSMITHEKRKYFLGVMDLLEQMGREGKVFGEDDKAVAAKYFVDYLATDVCTEEDVTRIQNFILGSEFGMSFAPEMRGTIIEKLDVPLVVESLFKAQKFLWAALLINRDPWPLHASASRWVNVLWKNRDQIPDALFLEAMTYTPNWLNVEGVDRILDGLMASAREDIGNEKALTSLLLHYPEKITSKRLEWLSLLSTKGLAQSVADSLSDQRWSPSSVKFLKERLAKRFSGLQFPMSSAFVGSSCAGKLVELNQSHIIRRHQE